MAFKNFGDFWRSLDADEKQQLVFDAQTNYSHLSNIANGGRGIGIELADRLISADSGITKTMIKNTNATRHGV